MSNLTSKRFAAATSPSKWKLPSESWYAKLAPHDDLIIDDAEELQRLQEMRHQAPVENLAERFGYYASKNPLLTEQQFGFVRKIVRSNFTVIGIKELGLAYTVGLWYSHSYPELMLVAGSAEASMEKMNLALQESGNLLWQERSVEAEVWQTDPRAFVEPRAHRLGQIAFKSLRNQGLRTETFDNADSDFLKAYPYGYGFHFYQRFADETDVPILRAKVE